MKAENAIGFASLRRDGFAGMVADGAGEVVTRPVVFSGAHLFVNADARFGALAAEVIDTDGNPFPWRSWLSRPERRIKDKQEDGLCLLDALLK